jgi:hypothetical protein
MTMAKINNDMKGPRRRVPRMRWYIFVTSTTVSVTTTEKATRCRKTVQYKTKHSTSRKLQVVSTVFIDLTDVWDFHSSGVTGQSERDVLSQRNVFILKGRYAKQEKLHTAETFLGSYQFLSYSGNPPHFVEPKFSFTGSQQSPLLPTVSQENPVPPQIKFVENLQEQPFMFMYNCMLK